MPGADLRTVLRLATRHLVVRRGRAAFLLLGYAIGAGVMMVLLSIGEAMLVQSRDVALVGGGEVTVLPEGVDLESLRTGAMSGLFFGIDRARLLERQLVGGPRHRAVVRETSPVIEHELLYLRRDGRDVPLRAGAEIPSAASAVGAGLDVVSGVWRDGPEDSAFSAPTAQALYDELDRFHAPEPDSTWAEWHYFNLMPSEGESWYVTYLVGGGLADGGGGAQLLVTRQREGRASQRFERWFRPDEIELDTTRASLALGPARVEQRNGRYRLSGSATGTAGTLSFEVEVVPEPNAYLPPLELGDERFRSGYVVPGVRATASGRFCLAGRCESVDGAPAYHDHNWGVWREVAWEWGQARGSRLSLLYGGVLGPERDAGADRQPFLLAVVDSLGIRQILRFERIEYRNPVPLASEPGLTAPRELAIRAGRGSDSLEILVRVAGAQATPVPTAGPDRVFLQLKGAFRVTGHLAGQPVADSGRGSFETFVRRVR
ncbi:MAG: hypothetical protein R2909_14655 [Gemmatimonadales bacterium]